MEDSTRMKCLFPFSAQNWDRMPPLDIGKMGSNFVELYGWNRPFIDIGYGFRFLFRSGNSVDCMWLKQYIHSSSEAGLVGRL